MANIVNLLSVPSGNTYDPANDPNPAFQAVFFRRLRPQPFNAGGVETNRPDSGQVWPRGYK